MVAVGITAIICFTLWAIVHEGAKSERSKNNAKSKSDNER